MNNDWFDRQLNEQYNMDRTPLDLEQAWTGFQQRRKKKRRPLGWWWIAGLLLVGIALGVWWASPEEGVNTNRNSNEDVKREVTKPVDDDVSRNLITDETQNKNNNMVAEQTEIQSPASDLLNKNLVVAPSAFKRNNALINGDVEPDYLVKPKEKNEIFTNKYNELIEDQKTDSSPPLVEEINATNQEEKVNPAVGLNDHNLTNEYADTELISEPEESNMMVENNIIQVNKKGEQDNIEITANEELTSEDEVALLPITKLNKWQTGLMFAYGFTQKSLKEKNAPHTTLKPEDKPMDVMVAGWDIRYYIRPAFFIQSGLNIHHYTDKRSVNYTEQRVWTDSNALVEQIIRADGMVTDIYGSVSVTETRRTTGVRYHTLTTINLPLMLGASLPLSKEWQLDLYGGVQGGIYQLSGKGYYTHECEACYFTENPYRTWGTLDAILRLEPTYTFNSSGWLIGGGLHGVVGLNNNMNERSGLTEHRHSLGMSVVVRKQF